MGVGDRDPEALDSGSPKAAALKCWPMVPDRSGAGPGSLNHVAHDPHCRASCPPLHSGGRPRRPQPCGRHPFRRWACHEGRRSEPRAESRRSRRRWNRPITVVGFPLENYVPDSRCAWCPWAEGCESSKLLSGIFQAQKPETHRALASRRTTTTTAWSRVHFHGPEFVKLEVTNVALYIRCSAPDQRSNNSLGQLRRFVQERAWTVAGEFVDRSTGRRSPEFDLVREAVRRGNIEIVVVPQIEHLGSSVPRLLRLLDDLRNRGVRVVTLCGLDTGTAGGHTVMEFVRRMIQADDYFAKGRSAEALLETRRRGISIGRPRTTVDVARARVLQGQGWGLRRIARELGVGTATLHRALDRGTP